MRKRSYTATGIGAPSLMLILVVLSLSILAALTVLNARNDSRLSARSVSVTESVYGLYAEAEERFAELDALARECRAGSSDEETFFERFAERLPEDVTEEAEKLSFSVTDGVRRVTCTAETVFAEDGRLNWVSRSLSADTEEEWN